MSGTWISVDEKLPHMAAPYIGGPKAARVIGFHHWVGECRFEETFKKRIPVWKNSLGRRCTVTHWMPLPEPPKQV